MERLGVTDSGKPGAIPMVAGFFCAVAVDIRSAVVAFPVNHRLAGFDHALMTGASFNCFECFSKCLPYMSECTCYPYTCHNSDLLKNSD